jgi:hypothetical protein
MSWGNIFPEILLPIKFYAEHQKVMKKVQALSDDEILNLPRTSSVVLQVLTSMIIPLDSLE